MVLVVSISIVMNKNTFQIGFLRMANMAVLIEGGIMVVNYAVLVKTWTVLG